MKFFSKEPNNELIPVKAEDATLICEAALLEALSAGEAESICADKSMVSDLIKDEIVTEKSIVRLDKKARMAGATKTAVYTIARQRKDPKFKKLLTLWRMEAQLEKELYKKYKNEAIIKAKKSFNSNTVGTKPSISKHGVNSVAVKTAISKAKAQLKTH